MRRYLSGVVIGYIGMQHMVCCLPVFSYRMLRLWSLLLGLASIRDN